MARIRDIKDIESVSLIGYYTAWGDDTCEVFDISIKNAVSEWLDCENEDEFRKKLKSRFVPSQYTNDVIEKIINYSDYGLYSFQASITTTMNFETGEVIKKCTLDGDFYQFRHRSNVVSQLVEYEEEE